MLLANLLEQIQKNHDQSKWLARLMLCFSLFALVLTFWQTLSTRGGVEAFEARADASPDLETRPHALPELSEWHIFGKADETMALVTPIAQSAGIMVHGIFAGDKPKQNTAIVALSGQRSKVVRQEERLADGTVIKKIQPQQIIVERQGRLQSVALKKNSPLFG